MFKTTALITAASAALVAGQAGAINIDASSPLVPTGLGNGDTFQLIFVTDRDNRVTADELDGTVDNTDNTVIGDWNAFVNTIADGSTIAGVPDINWFAVVSVQDISEGSVDPGVAARDNAQALDDVYRLDGGLVAAQADFYTSTHLLPINIEQNGNTINTQGGSGAGRLVWSGSRSDGTIDPRPLGNPGSNTGNFGSRTGNAPATNDDWLNRSDAERRGPSTALRVYALSELITIGAAGPAADLSGDGDVDDEDLGLFFSAFTGPDNGPSLDPRADLSGDGDVDDEDLGLAFSEFTGPLGPASVPEPTSLALLGLGGLLVARRRR